MKTYIKGMIHIHKNTKQVLVQHIIQGRRVWTPIDSTINTSNFQHGQRVNAVINENVIVKLSECENTALYCRIPD